MMNISKLLPALLIALTVTAPLHAQRGRRGGGGEVVTVDPAKAAAIKGKVVLDGTAPKERVITMDADPVCLASHEGTIMTKRVPVNEAGEMEDVFVHISAGLEGKSFAVSEEPVILDQIGCVYTPRVLGLQAGQQLAIRNSDATLHNVHMVSGEKDLFNLAMPTKDMEIKQKIRDPQVMVDVKCDVHPWMFAFIGVTEHPFFDVTDAEGNFEITGLPAGTYTVTTWQRLAGEKSQEVTVGEAETSEIAFTYSRKK